MQSPSVRVLHRFTLPVIAIVALLVAGACGQKGDLYLPDHPQALAVDSSPSTR